MIKFIIAEIVYSTGSNIKIAVKDITWDKGGQVGFVFLDKEEMEWLNGRLPPDVYTRVNPVDVAHIVTIFYKEVTFV